MPLTSSRASPASLQRVQWGAEREFGQREASQAEARSRGLDFPTASVLHSSDPLEKDRCRIPKKDYGGAASLRSHNHPAGGLNINWATTLHRMAEDEANNWLTASQQQRHCKVPCINPTAT